MNALQAKTSAAIKRPMRGRYSWVVMVLTAFLSVRSVGADTPEIMTEEAAVISALARPAVAHLVTGAGEVARGDSVSASAWANPVLSYNREQVPGGSSGSAEDILTLEQQLDLGGRRSLRGRAGRERVLAAGDEGDWMRAGIAAEARRRFVDVLATEARLAAAEGWLRRIDEAAEAVGRRAAAGDVSEYDHRRLLRERAGAAARVQEKRAEVAASRARLGAIVGSPGGAFALQGSLVPESRIPELHDLLVRLDDRPDLRALGREATAADLERRAGGRGWVPDLTILGGMKSAGTAGGRDWGFVAGASLDLPFLENGRGESLQAAGRGRMAEARRVIVRAEAEGEVAALHALATGLSEVAAGFRSQAVGPSVDLARIAETAYRAGEVGVLELVDAWRSLLDASMQAVDLETAARKARIDLDREVGRQRD
jgi:cobalt-zinc-cadmium efflux system outer membrane protein